MAGANVRGAGCGGAVLLLAALPLALLWLVLGWFGLLDGLSLHGRSWLVLSTAAAVAVLPVSLMLIVMMVLTDSVPDPLPLRVRFAWLLVLLPVLNVVAIVAVWTCYGLDLPGAADRLALGPWLAGLALAATSATVYSGLAAHET